MRLLLLCLGWLWLTGGAAAAELRLAVSVGPVSLPIYVAQAKNFFRDEGVSLVLRDCVSGRECMDALRRGEVELATAAELMVTLDSPRSPDTVVLASISASTRHIKLVGRQAAGIKAADDLRGKTIGTVARSSAQYFLDNWLLFHDIDPAAVRVVPMAPRGLPGALARGEVDAVAVWEPTASDTVAELGMGAVVLPSARVYTQHFCLISSRRLAYSRQAEFLRVLRALARAEAFIADNREAAADIARARFAGGMTQSQLDEHVFRLALDQSLISTMESQARWARQRGLVDDAVPPRNMLLHIEAGLLRAIAPAAVTLTR